MKHISLFSGIGGFNLACEWAGIETILNCEIDKFCQKVLLKHYPNVPIVEDVNNVTEIQQILTSYSQQYGLGQWRKQSTMGEKSKEMGEGQYQSSVTSKDSNRDIGRGNNAEEIKAIADTTSKPSSAREYIKSGKPQQGESGRRSGESLILTAGFPCQPFSNAGRKRGARDDRYLWPATLKVIESVKPDWVCLENVAGLLNMVFPDSAIGVASQASLFSGEGETIRAYETIIGRIESDLRQAGYETVWFVIPACAIGAPHRRDRVWILAANTNHRREGSLNRRRGLREGLSGKMGDLRQRLCADENRTENNFTSSVCNECTSRDGCRPYQSESIRQSKTESSYSSALLKYAQQEEAGWSQFTEGQESLEGDNLCEQSENLVGSIQDRTGSKESIRASEDKIQPKPNNQEQSGDRWASGTEGCGGDATNANQQGLQGEQSRESLRHTGQPDRIRGNEIPNWQENWYEVASRVCGIYDGLPAWMDKNGGLLNGQTGVRISRQDLSNVWDEFQQSAIWEHVGRFYKIPKKEILFSALRKLQTESEKQENILFESQTVQENILRDMPLWGFTRYTPLEWESERQQSREYKNALSPLSHEITLATESLFWWYQCTTDNKDRVNRLKSLGISIVPQVAYEVIKAMLNERI